ncbi:hypothetical protein PHYPSEUDO_014662 [Phytophthora pseudosyringae]|uniref:Uncharacterized protein n=1 Tax=Phytophthora pseudosyringae TaxID=221518 RepID=A0A8T1W063_9STRA|nr:hypothetical protein PHYPSEUDO_014662 [Phytophthora pseudosyringae]
MKPHRVMDSFLAPQGEENASSREHQRVEKLGLARFAVALEGLEEEAGVFAFCTVETICVTKKNVSGAEGSDGSSRRPARDGRKSPSFHGFVHQWYYTGGLFRGSTEQPIIEIEETPAPARTVLEANPAVGSRVEAIPNTTLGTAFVKETHELLVAQLESTFPQCVFGESGIDWEI